MIRRYRAMPSRVCALLLLPRPLAFRPSSSIREYVCVCINDRNHSVNSLSCCAHTMISSFIAVYFNSCFASTLTGSAHTHSYTLLDADDVSHRSSHTRHPFLPAPSSVSSGGAVCVCLGQCHASDDEARQRAIRTMSMNTLQRCVSVNERFSHSPSHSASRDACIASNPSESAAALDVPMTMAMVVEEMLATMCVSQRHLELQRQQRALESVLNDGVSASSFQFSGKVAQQRRVSYVSHHIAQCLPPRPRRRRRRQRQTSEHNTSNPYTAVSHSSLILIDSRTLVSSYHTRASRFLLSLHSLRCDAHVT